MFGTEGGWGFGMGAGMWLVWILVLVVFVALVKIFSGSQGSTPPSHDEPMEILRRRYASGEIDDKEFARLRQELKK